MRRVWLLGALLAAGALWTAALAIAPVVVSSGTRSGGWHGALAVYAVSSLVCHQRPDRSFLVHGVQWPVCARCAGLYVGGVAGLLGWAVVRRRVRVVVSAMRGPLLIAAAPTMVSVVTAGLGVWDPDSTLRALLALPLGGGVGALLGMVAAGDL